MNKKSEEELNAYLKGEYMAIKSYQDFIERTKDPSIRQKLQSIRQDHERHAVRISERISNLGGRPVKGAGFMGIMSDIRNLMKKTAAIPNLLLKMREGENIEGFKWLRK